MAKTNKRQISYRNQCLQKSLQNTDNQIHFCVEICMIKTSFLQISGHMSFNQVIYIHGAVVVAAGMVVLSNWWESPGFNICDVVSHCAVVKGHLSHLRSMTILVRFH